MNMATNGVLAALPIVSLVVAAKPVRTVDLKGNIHLMESKS